jgi:pyruvate dehydrogenase E2 component (dihydrolipoamide acetyltransferase)
VAILGVVRSRWRRSGTARSSSPADAAGVVSYDHRVIDGALAARFTRHLCTVLEDVRRLIL